MQLLLRLTRSKAIQKLTNGNTSVPNLVLLLKLIFEALLQLPRGRQIDALYFRRLFEFLQVLRRKLAVCILDALKRLVLGREVEAQSRARESAYD